MGATLVAAMAAGMLAVTGAGAQTAPGLPTASQLEQARARIDAERATMFGLGSLSKKDGARLPSDADIERQVRNIDAERKAMFDQANPASQPGTNSFPSIDTPPASQVDLEALARRYERKVDARQADGLMVFASFSMPAQSLKRLLADANRSGAVMVLRGFMDGSIKSTTLAVGALGESDGNIQINPEAFTKYRISAVPAVVLVKSGAAELVGNDGCALPDNYVMVSGDVTLAYALAEIERRSAAFRDIASRYLRPLGGGGTR